MTWECLKAVMSVQAFLKPRALCIRARFSDGREPEENRTTTHFKYARVMINTMITETLKGIRFTGRHALSSDDLKNGLAAGFAAVSAMSIFILLNDKLGLIPQVNLIDDMSHLIKMLTGVGLPLPLGFLLHLVLGSYVFGCGFAVLFGSFTRNFVLCGLIFGLLLWIGATLIVCPMLGQGFFGLRLGLGLIPAAALLFFHGVYGVALGAAFGSMQGRRVRSN